MDFLLLATVAPTPPPTAAATTTTAATPIASQVLREMRGFPRAFDASTWASMSSHSSLHWTPSVASSRCWTPSSLSRYTEPATSSAVHGCGLLYIDSESCTLVQRGDDLNGVAGLSYLRLKVGSPTRPG